MTKFELETKINEYCYKNLKDFLQQVELVEDQLIDIICSEQIEEIKTKFGKRILNTKETISILGGSSATFHRKKDRLEVPKFTQDSPRAPLFFSIRHVAVALYIKEHPDLFAINKIVKLLKEI